MSRNWAMFWVSLAVMFASAAVIVASARLERLSIGSLGEWVSGIAAAAAAAVALFIAHNEGRRAREIVAAQEKKERDAERQATLKVLKSLLLVVTNAEQIVAGTRQKIIADPRGTKIFCRTIISLDPIAVFARTLDDVGSHSMPNSVALDLFMTSRLYVSTIQEQFNEWAEDPRELNMDAVLQCPIWESGQDIVERIADQFVLRTADRPPLHETSMVQAAIQAAVSRYARS